MDLSSSSSPSIQELNYLKECIAKQHEQQCLLEQIVSNISSLLEGSSDAMCIFDKDGYFMHANANCRKILGIHEQQTTKKNMFDYYTEYERDRVFGEVIQRRALKWGGHVTFVKGGIGSAGSSTTTTTTTTTEIRAFQIIELLHSNKNNIEGTFFKSYISLPQQIQQPQTQQQQQPPHLHQQQPQPQPHHHHEDHVCCATPQEKLQLYYEMIRHMPVGVGIWRLEKTPTNVKTNTLRLVCANGLASQYVGVALHMGKEVHDTLPNGAEVHQFLEEVVKGQRVSTLDSFRTVGGREVAVTAFPLSHEYVAVALESPKRDNWASALDSACLGIAVCEGLRILHCNDPFSLVVGKQKEITNKDVVTLLDQYARPSSRSQLFELRRAILESRIHHVDVDLDQYQWRVCVHPLADGFKRCIVVTYRLNTKPPPQINRGTFPILPHLREALPLAPTTSQSNQSPVTSSPSSNPITTSAQAAPKPSVSTDNVYSDLVENFPCGVAIVRAERHKDKIGFRFVAINKAGRVFSNHLISGKYFDESSPTPFDTPFVQLLIASSQTHERRVAGRLNLYGSCLLLAARTIPLRDQYIGIAFEEASVILPQASSPQRPTKRSHSEIDYGHQILPSNQTAPTQVHATPQTPVVDSSQVPPQPSPSQAPAPQTQPMKTPHEVSPLNRNSQPDSSLVNMAPRQLSQPLPDFERFTTSLPKPFLPPIQSASQAFSGANSGREKFEPIFQQCIIGIACCDMQGQLSIVNRSFSQMLGHIDHELVDQPLLSLIFTEDSGDVQAVLRQLACGESNSFEMPLRLLHKRAHPIWTLATFVVYKTLGERSNIMLQVQLPSKLSRFPEVLLADREILRSALFKELVVGSALLEFGGTSLSFVSASSSFCDTLKLNEGELSGRLLTDIAHADDREKITNAAHDVITTRVLQQILTRVSLKDGSFAMAVLSLSPVLDSKSKPLLLVVQIQLDKAPSSFGVGSQFL